MVKRLLFSIVCFIIAALQNFPVAAADDATESADLGTVTVVASPIIEANEVDRYAGEKSIVSEDQIRDLNAQDVTSALRKTPGVNISRYNMIGSFGGATGGGVFIRGMGSSRPGAEIRTLVDGIPMYMSVWNHPLLDLMSIDTAHSMEVYKSPQPYIFGNAFGVVNIQPKVVTENGFITRAETAFGSYGTAIGKAEHGGKIDRMDYYIGGGYRTSDGHRDNSDGELKDFYGRFGYQLTDQWKVSYFTLCTDNYADDPGAKGAAESLRQGRYETRAWMNVATIENHYDNADGTIKFYRNDGEGDWLDQPTTTAGVREDLFNDFLFYGVKARERFTPWSGGEIIVGTDWDVTDGDYDIKNSDGTKDSWDGYDFTVTSPYAAISHQFGTKDGFYATPSAGARYYNNSDFDSEWSPHAGILLGYKESELHFGYSRGVIYPGLDVVLMSEKLIPMLKDTWKDLTAETVDHYEIGVSHHFGSMAVADVTAFYDDGKNRYVVVPPPPPPPIYDNIETYRIKGVETTLNLFPTNDLSLFFGVTYLDTEPVDLPYAPEVTFSSGANWRFLKAFQLSLDCQYLDKMFVDSQARRKNAENTLTVDSYFLVNGKLSYRFDVPSLKSQVEVYLAGENLTDEDYEYYPGYPMPGVTGMVGVRLSL
jgi:outer membrane cobalamin receptor